MPEVDQFTPDEMRNRAMPNFSYHLLGRFAAHLEWLLDRDGTPPSAAARQRIESDLAAFRSLTRTESLASDQADAQRWYRENEKAIRAAGVSAAPDFMVPF